MSVGGNNGRFAVLLVRALSVMLLAAPVATPAQAGGFYVIPTTLDLTKNAKSGSFTVINSGDARLDFKVSVQAWTQGADGKDGYADAPEIVYFPKIMSVEARERRAIRVGVKGPPPAREKAYRIFVEEIAGPETTPVTRFQQGNVSAAIAFAYRFSIPIFWKPPKAQGGGALERVEMARGLARAIVSNTGNTHLKIPVLRFRGKSADGQELFSTEMNGWYILEGRSRAYEFTVPPGACGTLAVVEVEAKTEKGTFDGILNVAKEMCTP